MTGANLITQQLNGLKVVLRCWIIYFSDYITHCEMNNISKYLYEVLISIFLNNWGIGRYSCMKCILCKNELTIPEKTAQVHNILNCTEN